jgi:hypothetical protein
VTEWENKNKHKKDQNENGSENPQSDQGWVYVIIGIRESLGLPPNNLM